MLSTFNKPESAVAVDVGKLCQPLTANGASAIDVFYEIRDEVIRWAYQVPFTTQPTLRSNLLLMIFSAAEAYFRRVLAEVLTICPTAAECAAQQLVPLGAIASFGVDNLGLVISDTRGLTSSGEIGKRTTGLLGLAIQKNSSVSVAIEQFEQFCSIRHCIVHSSGELLYSNRRELEVKHLGRLRIDLDDKAFQDVVQIVVNAVRSYNNFVANEVLQRWFVSGHLCKVWAKDRKTFMRFHELFVSLRDGGGATRPFVVYAGARTAMSSTP